MAVAGSASLRSAEVLLPSDEQAPSQARRCTESVLLDWSLPSLVDDATLVVSELVTNAVRYGAPPLCLLLRRRTDEVRVDVHDANPNGPSSDPEALPWDESGRGLAICRAIADDVGWSGVPGHGKIVYASFAV